ncbi:unnamed protein product [Prunus armeniaca]
MKVSYADVVVPYYPIISPPRRNNPPPSHLLLFIQTVFPPPSPPLATKLHDIGAKTSSSLPSSYPDPSPPPPLSVVAGNCRKVAGFTHNLKELVRVIPATKFFELGMFSHPLNVI